jgi:hypothetical protein
MFFHHLSFGEQFILWAIRKWYESFLGEYNAYDFLLNAFRLARVPNALPALDHFLTILVISNETKIEIMPSDHHALSLDECKILTALALLQMGGQKKRVSILFGQWLAPSGRRLGCNVGEILSQELSSAGHHLDVQKLDTLNASSSNRMTEANQPSITLN